MDEAEKIKEPGKNRKAVFQKPQPQTRPQTGTESSLWSDTGTYQDFSFISRLNSLVSDCGTEYNVRKFARELLKAGKAGLKIPMIMTKTNEAGVTNGLVGNMLPCSDENHKCLLLHCYTTFEDAARCAAARCVSGTFSKAGWFPLNDLISQISGSKEFLGLGLLFNATANPERTILIPRSLLRDPYGGNAVMGLWMRKKLLWQNCIDMVQSLLANGSSFAVPGTGSALLNEGYKSSLPDMKSELELLLSGDNLTGSPEQDWQKEKDECIDWFISFIEGMTNHPGQNKLIIELLQKYDPEMFSDIMHIGKNMDRSNLHKIISQIVTEDTLDAFSDLRMLDSSIRKNTQEDMHAPAKKQPLTGRKTRH